MNPLTLEALKESIRHWKRMKKMPLAERKLAWATLSGEIPSGNQCALCERFIQRFSGDCVREEVDGSKEACPIAAKTGKSGCEGTPFYRAHRFYRSAPMEVWERNAQAMIDFLEKLLPSRRSRRLTTAA